MSKRSAERYWPLMDIEMYLDLALSGNAVLVEVGVIAFLKMSLQLFSASVDLNADRKENADMLCSISASRVRLV